MSQTVKAGPRCPEDTPFKQQRLPAWQPILTPNWVIGTFLIIGCIFLPIGGAIFAASSGVTEFRSAYGDVSACKSGGKTVVKIVPEKDMKNPFMYYELTNFYQNHRRYVTSRSDAQLRAADPAFESTEFEKAATNAATALCTPLTCAGNAGKDGCGTKDASVKANGRWNLIYYPCGLIARSKFNDTFSNLREDSGANITLNKKKISWPSDIEKKFISPNAERIKPDSVNLQGFISKHCGGFGDFCTLQDAAHPENRSIAQAACELSGWCSTYIDPSKPESGFFTVDILRKIAFNNQYVESGAGQTLCNTPIQPRPEQIYNCWHSPTDESLVVWMRTAALPTFRKLYARIDTELKAGKTYLLDVECRFPVNVFGGTKSIILSTTSWIGGKNNFLAGSYLAVGSVCILLAIVFLAKHVISPRSLSSAENLEFIK